MKSVVLLSGGLDSSTVAAIAKAAGDEVYALSFDYGQRHSKEKDCAKRVGEALGVKEHIVISFDLSKWGGSALTDQNIDVPTSRSLREMTDKIPVTYVPARNMIFQAFAASYAEKVGAERIYVGMNCIDYSGYVDCRPEAIKAMNQAVRMNTVCCVNKVHDIEIIAPLLYMNKAAIVKKGKELGLDYGLTWSCYNGGEKACGKCDSCILRLNGFKEAGHVDPISYE